MIDPETPSILASVVGPLGVNGTVEATVGVDGLGDGTLTFTGANLVVDNVVDHFVDLDGVGLGTTNLDMVGVGLGVSSSGIPVVNFLWDLDNIGAPTSFDLGLNQGALTLHGHTGALALFLAEPEVIDLTTSPVTVAIEDIAGFGIGGVATDPFISLLIPAIDVDLGGDALGIPGLLFVRLIGEVNLAIVPEPGSMALLGAGMIGLVTVGIRRRRLR